MTWLWILFIGVLCFLSPTYIVLNDIKQKGLKTKEEIAEYLERIPYEISFDMLMKIQMFVISGIGFIFIGVLLFYFGMLL